MSQTARAFTDQTFTGFRDRDSARVFSDIAFRRCDFENCLLSKTREPRLRATIRNVSIVDCTDNASSIGAAIVEDVLVDTLRSPGVLHTYGAAFKHVMLRGKFDRLMLSSLVDLMGNEPSVQAAFDEANAEFYRHVDWALDISQGEFKELCIRGLPGHLIRRDPETQVLVTREKALQEKWRDLEYRDGLCAFSLDLFLEREEPSIVLVAPKCHRKFKDQLWDLQQLRKAGVAEPD